MTHEFRKTLVFVAAAALLMGAAFVNLPDRGGKAEEFNDIGKKFFPDFKDPNEANSLEVVDVDPDTAVVHPFKVQFQNGRWTIPSHYDYPADGKDRLAKTATGVMDLTKDKMASDLVEDHEKLGVIDPLDPKATSIKGRGKRVTIKDSAENPIADFIIGNPVKDHPDQRYVRVPTQKRTYGVKVDVDLSTRFADWIETNLLKLDVGRVRKVKFNGTKLEQRGRELVENPADPVIIQRKDSSTPWTIDGATIPAGKEIDTDKLSALTTALGDVKIVGVRPKPSGLTRDLMATGEVKGITTNEAFRSLANKGFFLGRDNRVLSSQGESQVSTADGAVYTLRFGEVELASGDELSRGADEKAAAEKKDDKGKDATKKDEKKPGAVESRYLLVTIAFDPKLVDPLPDPDANMPLDVPKDPFWKAPGTPERVAAEKAAKEKADKRKEEEAKHVAEAEKKVKELSDRFAGWYYLTPNEAYKGLVLDKVALVRDKKPPTPPGGPGGMPGGFPGGMPNFPGMMPGGPGGNPHGE
jgi:hypothetical protein